MRLVRVPLRISLVGGGSDLPSHYEQNGGAVVSFTIDKYIYITAKKNVSLFPHRYRLVYSTVEECNDRVDIQHPIIRQLCDEYSVSALDLDVMSDVPAGTGLGSSSAFTVGLHMALGNCSDKHFLAESACNTEIYSLAEPIGKQDQYAAAFGGLNCFEFFEERVVVAPIILGKEEVQKLRACLHLVYIGGQRSASDLLVQIQQTDTYASLTALADLAVETYNQLRVGSIDAVGPLIKAGWDIKRELSDKVSTPIIDAIIDTAIANGATGGKLLGAGGAGFVLLFCPPKYKESMRKALSSFNLEYINFNFDNEGAKVLYGD